MGKWALLLVDIQRDFFDEIAPHFPDYGAQVARLLAACREIGMPVWHVRAEFAPDQSDWMLRYRQKGGIPCITGTPGAQVMPFAQPLPGEPTWVKKRFSAFCRTELEQALRAQGIETVVIAGLVTSVCVALTATDAYQRDFWPLVIREAVADEPAAHESALASLHRLTAHVVGLKRFLANVARWREEDRTRPESTPYDFRRFVTTS